MDIHILVVDDEPEIADLVEVYLRSEGFIVHTCGTAGEALAALEQQPMDLAILDVMLPDKSGFDLCGELRREHRFPVLMLTARTSDMDKITGLTIGADDYITKPFNPLELVARVKAQLRRYTRYNSAQEKGPGGDVIDFNGLVIDRGTHQCTLYDISAERLFETVWGEKYLDRNNTVMVHIRRLREKMGEPSRDPRFIKTVWGVGYKID